MSCQTSNQLLSSAGPSFLPDAEVPVVQFEDSMYDVIQKAKDGEEDAVRDIWDQYFPQLVRLAGRRLDGQRARAADEEDIAISVMESFFRAAREDRFPDLKDKDGIWRLLARMTHRKVIDLVRRNAARPAMGESALDAGSDMAHPVASLADSDPTPAVTVLVADEIERLLAVIPEKYRPLASMKLQCLTGPEMAERCNVHISTIERRLRIIRGLWTKEMENED